MKYKTGVLWSLLIFRFILQYLLIDPVYELHRDEFLHLDQARHLAWGFTSVPPVTSWISWIILQLGNGLFWVKFFPALFGALTVLLVWKTIEELNGQWFALLLGTFSVLFSALLRINILYQPNSLDILSWTMLLFTVVKYIRSENNKWLWVLAVTFALGFLNKYNILFLLLGLFPALLLSEHRRIFRNKIYYCSIGFAFLLILPNLIWQYQQGFPVVRHMNELVRTQLVNVNRIDFLKEQLLFFMGGLYVILAAFVAFIIYPPYRKYRIFGLMFLFTMALFFYLKAKAYYAIGLYPIMLAFGAVYLEQVLTGRRLKYLRAFALATTVLLFVPVFQIAFPNRTPIEIRQHAQQYQEMGMLRWEDGKDHDLPQDFADMLGWKELAQKVDEAMATIPDKEHTIVLCDNYGEAGAINYYSGIKNIGAVSMKADYINWIRLDNEIQNVVLIHEANDEDPLRNKERPLFETIKKTGEITNEFAREKGTRIYILRTAKTDINKILRDEIIKNKSKN